MTTIFLLKILYITGYNLKNPRNGKSISKIPMKMTKFEVPNIKE